MEDYIIRPARADELAAVEAIYAAARRFMAANGNASQWGDAYPPTELLASDIEKGQLYVLDCGGAPHGVFAFIGGEEPTYARIEGRGWLSDAPYRTIHRLAADGAVKGVFARCISYCKQRCGHLRIDTHENNRVMRHLIEKHGFAPCGTIWVQDGSPRLAYEYISE